MIDTELHAIWLNLGRSSEHADWKGVDRSLHSLAQYLLEHGGDESPAVWPTKAKAVVDWEIVAEQRSSQLDELRRMLSDAKASAEDWKRAAEQQTEQVANLENTSEDWKRKAEELYQDLKKMKEERDMARNRLFLYRSNQESQE